jgi:hypothetical protein
MQFTEFNGFSPHRSSCTRHLTAAITARLRSAHPDAAVQVENLKATFEAGFSHVRCKRVETRRFQVEGSGFKGLAKP